MSFDIFDCSPSLPIQYLFEVFDINCITSITLITFDEKWENQLEVGIVPIVVDL